MKYKKRKRLAHPSADWLKGGGCHIHELHHVVPVEGDDPTLSEQARKIHAWLLDEYARTGKPIAKRDVIKEHGVIHRMFKVKFLKGSPLEELMEASLLYVEEDRHPELEGEDYE